ncbi:hypothetical protein QBZ16_002273 [Prototheca wickerhamii]|uniref:AAA+ ATPase domain-containing protein n=1 Tax=Prototheca wickerhamii TaxID=3111 RepID=A0AAD9MML2_PROWI|nr:hypothetical protein QBZ16_002273 [Prototheca wickerhamii]
MERVRRLFAWRGLRRASALFLVAYLTLGVLANATGHGPSTQSVLYSDFLRLASGGGVETVLFEGQKIAAPDRIRYETTALPGHDPVPLLLAHGVRFGGAAPSVGGALRRAAGGLVSTLLPFAPTLWPGVDAAVRELEECVRCLREPERFAALGARLPSGVLLHGPPGTGKTLLARAVAGEAGVPFFVASASEFVELYVGRGAQRVRELFARAKESAPCVVFIDELDAVGQRRGLGQHEEREQTLDQLLTELDGFEARPGVLLLAATNRAASLDPALLRPGRLSRKIAVALPDEAGRAAILAVHLRRTPLAAGADGARLCAAIARVTPGMSGAELMNVVNEAAFVAVRAGRDAVGLPELLEAVRRTRHGVQAGGASPMQRLGAKLAHGLQRIAGQAETQPPRQPRALTGGGGGPSEDR